MKIELSLSDIHQREKRILALMQSIAETGSVNQRIADLWMGGVVAPYCTDADAACKVLQKMHDAGWFVEITWPSCNPGPRVRFDHRSDPDRSGWIWESSSLADGICKMAIATEQLMKERGST